MVMRINCHQSDQTISLKHAMMMRVNRHKSDQTILLRHVNDDESKSPPK